jgi:hypothetical protein
MRLLISSLSRFWASIKPIKISKETEKTPSKADCLFKYVIIVIDP